MFIESRFRQYITVPPSLPGGEEELSMLDNEGGVWNTENQARDQKGIRALTCICGSPVPLGPLRRQVPGDYISFRESFEMAMRHRATLGTQVIIAGLRTRFASKELHNDLAERIARMEDHVRALPRPKKKP